MNKENILFGIIGLLVGLIVGFLATNYINRSETAQIVAVPTNAAQPKNPHAGNVPQINNQVVRDQTQTGGMMPQVQEIINRAKNEPNNYEAQMAAGEIYYKIQRFAESAHFFEKASELKPGDFGTLVKAGNAYYDAGAMLMENGGDGTPNFKLAEKFYTAALAKNANDVNVRTDLGLTFFLRQPKEVDRAIAEYRKSLEINPNHELTLQNLAAAYKEKGDNAALQETLARLQKVNPNNPILGKQQMPN